MILIDVQFSSESNFEDLSFIVRRALDKIVWVPLLNAMDTDPRLNEVREAIGLLNLPPRLDYVMEIRQARTGLPLPKYPDSWIVIRNTHLLVHP